MSSQTRPILQLLALLIILLSASVEASDNGYAWQDSSTNVSPSTAIVVIVLVLGFFLTGAIFIYIQHCVVSPSTTTTTTTTRGITANNAVRGLEKSLIDTFPEFQYSAVKELKLGKGDLECAVCLSEFQDDETLRFLPNCDHVFHSECIDTWLAGHHTCPVCRDDLAIIHEPALPVPNDEVQIAMPSQDEMTMTFQNKNGRLPRSHSTGHSLVQPGEVQERFTLRLPTEVRRQLLARAKFRAMSLVVLPRQSSSRKGYRGEGSGSSRYSRFFGRSFIMRMGSFKSTAKIGTDGDFPPRPLPV